MYKIIFLIPGTGEGASHIFSRREADYLKKYKLEIIKLHTGSIKSIKDIIKKIKKIKKEIENHNPDIVHAQYGTITATIAMLSLFRPYIITYRGSDLNPDPSVSIIRRIISFLLSQLAAIFAEHIICVSDELKKRLWFNHNKTSIIPTGVNTELFYPIDKIKARKILNLDIRQKIVVFNKGNNPIIKRMDIAINSIKHAEKIIGPIYFFILDGSIQPFKIPIILNAADCLLVTSDFEGSPTIVQEAIACNLPIISVDVGDVKEYINKCKISKIVDRDINKLGNAIANALNIGEREEYKKDILNKIAYSTTLFKQIKIYNNIIMRKKIKKIR